MRPRASETVQEAEILPFSTRFISTPATSTLLPVGSTPINAPLWVPVKVQRCATVSPSPIISPVSKRMSGNADRYIPMSLLTPSGPGGTSGAVGSWLTWSGDMSSSAASRSPVHHLLHEPADDLLVLL